MTVETRAAIVSEVAEDCIVKLLRSDPRDFYELEWRLAFQALQSESLCRLMLSITLTLVAQRHSSLFVRHNLPFVDIRDVLQPLRRRQFDTRPLEKANHLCNLATFIYIILDPDQATELLNSNVPRFDASQASSRSSRNKGKGRDRDPGSLRQHVQMRNRLLLMAWKVFWTVVVPLNQRGSQRAMEVWLNFSTQV
jgi:hypothetical protein